MLNHPPENDLELLATTPERLSAVRRTELEGHISSCSSCNDIVLLLQSFHRELTAGDTSRRKAELLLDRLFQHPNVIHLRAYRYTPDPSQFGRNVMTVLAAKSEGGPQYRYSSICTLVSHDEQTVVRILKDNDNNSYKAFLISKEGEQPTVALIRFPALDLNVVLEPSTHQASFSLPAAHRNIDWSNVVAELRLA